MSIEQEIVDFLKKTAKGNPDVDWDEVLDLVNDIKSDDTKCDIATFTENLHMTLYDKIEFN